MSRCKFQFRINLQVGSSKAKNWLATGRYDNRDPEISALAELDDAVAKVRELLATEIKGSLQGGAS